MSIETKLGFASYLARLLRARCVRILSHRRRRLGFPQIACVPGDDIGDQIIAHGRYEDLLLELLFENVLAPFRQRFASGVSLDVGANIGNHTLLFSRLFSKVLAFEPSPVAGRLLEASVLLNDLDNVEVLPVALSNRRGTATFYGNRGTNLGRSGLSDHLADSESRRFIVNLAIGDEVVPPLLDGRRVELVKIDVEGHEHSVLAGLHDVLREHDPIVLFEHHPAFLDGQDPMHELRKAGYTNFYVIDRNVSGSRATLLRLAYRMLNGNRLRVSRLEAPIGRRSYDLVVASRSALQKVDGENSRG